MIALEQVLGQHVFKDFGAALDQLLKHVLQFPFAELEYKQVAQRRPRPWVEALVRLAREPHEQARVSPIVEHVQQRRLDHLVAQKPLHIVENDKGRQVVLCVRFGAVGDRSECSGVNSIEDLRRRQTLEDTVLNTRPRLRRHAQEDSMVHMLLERLWALQQFIQQRGLARSGTDTG